MNHKNSSYKIFAIGDKAQVPVYSPKFPTDLAPITHYKEITIIGEFEDLAGGYTRYIMKDDEGYITKSNEWSWPIELSKQPLFKL